MTAMEYGYYITFLHMLLMFLELNGLKNYTGDPTQHKNWPLLNHGTSCGRRIWEYPEEKVSSPRVNTRIMGGSNAEKNEFPWVVGLLINVANDTHKNQELCGGSVINHRYVLTAARCCLHHDPLAISHDRIIALSDDNVKVPEKLLKRIEKVTVHEKYNPDLQNDTLPINDICLVRLEEPLKFSASIQPICLPVEREWETKDLTGTMMTAVGWGHTYDDDPPVVPKSLQKVSLPVAPIADCIKEWKVYYDGNPVEVNPQEQLCAGTRRQSLCKGDHGGPLMYRTLNNTEGVPRYFMAGLQSFANPCAMYFKLEYGVFVKVSHYIPWILDNIYE